MADRSSSDVRSPPDWRRRLLGVGLIVFGATIVIGTGADYYDAWTTARTWNASAEAALLAQQVAEPTPIWLLPATPEPAAAPIEPVPTAGVPAPSTTLAVSGSPLAVAFMAAAFHGTPLPATCP